jgi:hypothetical protein
MKNLLIAFILIFFCFGCEEQQPQEPVATEQPSTESTPTRFGVGSGYSEVRAIFGPPNSFHTETDTDYEDWIYNPELTNPIRIYFESGRVHHWENVPSEYLK